ncbi:hypothetical protein [Pontibacillus marinus]|uniref:Uncharacterized protein n=1 Tax=Pontibacillus marinus BH030004 = DSM 16465 TaxID=1385511 RepID=A0A0A5FW74_9BACI|nr:hypothetical protein [Pontibacillus marinus]KGX84164.1 hypothetical protein N783_18925 [Pontibacillus marinus BH030004 = DSM 16465]
MRKYIILICGILIWSIAFFVLYKSYAPRVGPIGEGLDYKSVWFNFGWQFFIGLSAIIQSILLFKKEKDQQQYS